MDRNKRHKNIFNTNKCIYNFCISHLFNENVDSVLFLLKKKNNISKEDYSKALSAVKKFENKNYN